MSNDPTGDLLVNTIGAYTGTTVYGFNAFSDATSLEINADDNWTITIAPISTAPALIASGTVPLSSGPSVISVKADGAWTLLAE